jgi:hypothetical protein
MKNKCFVKYQNMSTIRAPFCIYYVCLNCHLLTFEVPRFKWPVTLRRTELNAKISGRRVYMITCLLITLVKIGPLAITFSENCHRPSKVNKS